MIYIHVCAYDNRIAVQYTRMCLLLIVFTHLTVSIIVTSDNKVVTSRTILPGTISGMTQNPPQDMTTNSVDGK